LKENHFLDDGAFLVAKLLIKMAQLNRENRSLISLIDPLVRPIEEGEFRLRILAEDFGSYGTEVLNQLADLIQKQKDWIPEKPNFEGIRVNCLSQEEDGWFLLRMSLHDPVMPLNVESNTPGGVEAITRRLGTLLGTFDRLGLDALDSS
jgi:phosphomannomutase